MKILFICGREPTYVRNQVLLKGLRENGVEVIECTSNAKTYFYRYISVMVKFFLNYFKDYDIIIIGFFGQPLVPLIKFFSSKPIVFDPFISGYETMCFDRKRFKPNSLIGRLFYHIDKHAFLIADLILVDANNQIKSFSQNFSIPKKKFHRIFLGFDDDTFYPRKNKKTKNFYVFTYTSYQPAHGMDVIIKAAKILESDPKIKFKIFGHGTDYQKTKDLIKKLNVKNVELFDWIQYKKIPIEVSKADICLGGVFGVTKKAKKAIAGKVYQFIAMRKPTIAGDTKATRELFTHKENIYLSKMGDAKFLARVIKELKNNSKLRNKIARNGYKLCMKKCVPKVLGKELVSILKTLN